MKQLILIAIVTSACVSAQRETQQLEVDRNTLGIVALQVEHSEDSGDNVFELRGLDASGDEVGQLRHRIGTVDDLTSYVSGVDSFGSEITISVASEDTRMVTREVQLIRLSSMDDTTEQFLEVAAVALAARGIEIEKRVEPGVDETSYFDSSTCSTAVVLNSPVAKQCCHKWPWSQGRAMHVDPSGAVVLRWQNPTAKACQASNGGPCQGSACYYGPLSFARPVITTPPPTTPYAKITPGYYCDVQWYASPQPATFGDVTGTTPRGQGCPGGTSGAGDWDY